MFSKPEVNVSVNDVRPENPPVRYHKPNLSPRTVLRSHSGLTLLRYWVHLLPIAATAVLAFLNMDNIFFMGSSDPNLIVKMNAFQFVAKLHEILLGASLTLALMDAIRSRLLSPDGVPLGFLLSPVRFSDLNWLISSDFWHSLRKSTRSSDLRSFGTALLIFVAIIFTVIGGPLSAILIVPRLGFSHSQPALYYPVFYNKSASDYSPSIVEAKFLNPVCFQLASDSNEGCPAEAVHITHIAMDPTFSPGILCSNLGNQISCNNTQASSSPNHITRDTSIEFDQRALTVVISTPKQVIYEDMAYRLDQGRSFPTDMSIGVPIDPSVEQIVNINFSGDDILYKSVTETTCRALNYSETLSLSQENHLNLSSNNQAVNWLGDITESKEPSFLFTFMKNSTVFHDNQACTGNDCYQAIACSVNAQWVPMQLWYNTLQPSLIYHSTPHPRSLLPFSTEGPKPRNITIKKDWLDAMHFGQTDFVTTIATLVNVWGVPMYGEPPSETQSGARLESLQPVNYTQAVSVIVSNVITLGLTEIGTHSAGDLYYGNCSDVPFGFTFDPQICAKIPEFWVENTDLGDLASEFTMATFSIRQYGYGWFLTSITVKIALGVLLLHALILTIYLLFVILLKRDITTCWSSSAELLVLAINSLQSRILHGNSTGMRANHELWSERVTVREVSTGLSPSTLTMVVGDPALYNGKVGEIPKLGEKYF